MKKTIVFFFLTTLILNFSACDKSKGYSLDDYWVGKGTIENPEQKGIFFLTLDDGTRLWTAAKSAQLYYYTPQDSQRVIAKYTILYDTNPKSDYKYDVRLNSIYELLTKPVFKITSETQDSIGNDPIFIEKIDLVGDFLDIKFSYWAGRGNTIHYINLVQNKDETFGSTEKPTANLEFRHNANKDRANYKTSGWASFKLKSLNEFPGESIKLIIKVKESDSKTSSYELQYKPNNPAIITTKTEMPKVKDKTN